MNNNIYEIKYPEKYEKYRKILKFIPPIALPLFIIILIIVMRPSIILSLIFIIIVIIISIFAYWKLNESEKYLPDKIRLDLDSIYVWRRNKKEESIPWDKVSRIKNIDPGAPDIFFVETKGEEAFSLIPKQLPLPSEVAQIAITKFNEYKKQSK